MKRAVGKRLLFCLLTMLLAIPYAACAIPQGDHVKLSVSVGSDGKATATVALDSLDRDLIEDAPKVELYTVYCLYAVSDAEKAALGKILIQQPNLDKNQDNIVNYLKNYPDRVFQYDLKDGEMDAFRTEPTRPTSWTCKFTGALASEANGKEVNYIAILYGQDETFKNNYVKGYYSSNMVTATNSWQNNSGKIASVRLARESYVYNGKACKPAVTVQDTNGKKLTQGTDYTVTYSNHKKCGRALVTVKGTGKYSGTVEKSFSILPKKAAITKLTPAKGSLKVTVKSQKASGIAGYQVAYRVAGTAKWKTTALAAKSTTVTIKSLKKDKKIEVRVRAYAMAGGKKMYGEYSKVKTSGKIK